MSDVDWNALVTDAENDLTKVLAARAVSGLLSVSWLSWLAGASGPLNFFLGLLIGQLVKYGDWGTYLLGDDWMNTVHGQTYQKAGEALDSLPPTATTEEINAAKQAKADAFDALMGAH